VAVGVKAPEGVATGTLAEVKTRTVQAESLYAVYVTVPVGLEPPVRVTRSVADPPIVIEPGVTVEVIVGVAFAAGPIVRVSPVAPQVVVTALRFVSPLYAAMKK